MRTISMHPMRVQKRLCVSVFEGKQSIYFARFWMCFVCFGVFVKPIVIFYIVFGFVVLNSIWLHGSKIYFFDFFVFKQCFRSVNNFRTEHFGMFLVFGGFLEYTKYTKITKYELWNLYKKYRNMFWYVLFPFRCLFRNCSKSSISFESILLLFVYFVQ